MMTFRFDGLCQGNGNENIDFFLDKLHRQRAKFSSVIMDLMKAHVKYCLPVFMYPGTRPTTA